MHHKSIENFWFSRKSVAHAFIFTKTCFLFFDSTNKRGAVTCATAPFLTSSCWSRTIFFFYWWFLVLHIISSPNFFQNINDNHSSKKSPSRLGSMLSLLRIIGLSQNICLCLFTGFTHHLCSQVNPFPWVVMLAVP